MSLLRLRGGGHEDEDQETLGKNTENTGKFLAISDSSATGHGFFPEGFPQKYPSGSVFARRRNAFSTGCTGKYSTGRDSTSHRSFSSTQNAEEIQSGDFSRSAETDFFHPRLQKSRK